MAPQGPSTSQVTVGDTIIQFGHWGDPAAQPIVLLHGAASRHQTWEHLVPPLVASGYQVIAPDLRGHGGSSRTASYPLVGFRDDIAGLLDALGLDQVTLIGHSLGGHVAGMIARQRPGRIARLVLEDPPVPPRVPRDNSHWSRMMTLRLFLAGLTRAGFDRRGVATVVEQLRVPDPAWWTGLTSLTMPTLIISGGPTSHISPSWLASMAEAIPNCSVATIPVGHRVHSLAPDRYRDVVLGFVAPGATAG